MLHDPRHDKTPSLAGFALFVASKPENQTYEWSNRCTCAMGQYLTSIGIEPDKIVWRGDVDIGNRLAHGANYPSGAVADATMWTFGKLADRILAHQRAKEKVPA